MLRTRLIWHLFANWCALVAAVFVACFWLASVELARLADEYQVRRMTDAATEITALLLAEVDQKEHVAGYNAAAFATGAAEIARTAHVAIDLLSLTGQVLDTTEALPDPARHPDAGQDWPTDGETLLDEARDGRVARSSRYDVASGKRILAVAVPLGTRGRPSAIVRVVATSKEADRELANSQRRMLAGYLCATAASLAAGYALAKRQARPVKDLSQAVVRLAAGDSNTAIPIPEPAELFELADAIGVLREQLVERGLTIGRQGTQQEAVLGSMIEGVLAIDARQRIVSINRAAADLLGLDPHAVIHRPLQEVVRNPDLRRFALRAIDCREPVEDDLVLRGLRDRTIRLQGTALRDVSGDGGAVIVLNDVTTIHHFEKVRRDFVANVSHELKTPVASIKGFVETLLDGAAEDPADNRRFLEIIAKQADRLASIIDDLLALSRIEQSEGTGNLPFEIVPIAEVFAAVIADCMPRAVDRSIVLDIACDESIQTAVNAPLLEQAVINLVDNAIKYSDPGKSVWLSASVAAAGTTELACEAGCVLIVVRDEGSGIEEEHLPRLFERFYRVDKARSRKLGGTGLGLSIVKHIVQAHGGTIAVQSQPGVGSAFTIALPLES